MNVITWFCLACKRQLMYPFFTILLLLMPAALYGYTQLEEQDSGKIRIALYSSEEQTLVPEIFGRLMEQNGMFQFYLCESEQMLKDDVAARKAECGYLFTEDFKKKLDQQDFRRSIEVYAAPSTMTEELAKEVVFAAVIESYGSVILERFLAEQEMFVQFGIGELKDKLMQGYELQQREGRTFSFRYETLSTEPLEQSVARIAFPVKGMLAIYLMVMGMFSAVALIRDEQKGLFVSLPYGSVLSCKAAVLAAPVVLAGMSVAVTLWVTGSEGELWNEAASLLAYLVLVTIVSYLWKGIVRDPLLLSALIPLMILMSLVICPVFIDISQWLPGVAKLRYLLLPYYYILNRLV